MAALVAGLPIHLRERALLAPRSIFFNRLN